MNPTEQERAAIRVFDPIWLKAIRRSHEIGHHGAATGTIDHLLGYIEELVWQRNGLKLQFIKHRTETHETAPTFCKTCRESDIVLGIA